MTRSSGRSRLEEATKPVPAGRLDLQPAARPVTGVNQTQARYATLLALSGLPLVRAMKVWTLCKGNLLGPFKS